MSPRPRPLHALPDDLRGRVQTVRQPGDEMTQHGWQRPLVLLPPPPPERFSVAHRLLLLACVALLLTLIVLAIGAHS